MSMETVGGEQSREKMKKDKKRKASTQEKPSAPSTSHKISTNPMEKKKQKRAQDKERRRVESENKVSESKVKEVATSESRSNEERMEISPTISSGSSGLPEFHIGVFKDLSAAEASMREAAAQALVAELLEVQKAYDELENKEAAEGPLKLEAEKDDGLNNCAPSLRYAVRRLIRGVSSSRECARQGFALGMTALVGVVPCIKVDALLKLIVDILEVSSSMKGQDIRDSLLGRLFSYGAIAKSGRLTLEWTADNNTPYIKEFVGSLVLLATKKRYLQEPAVSIILELVEKLPVEALFNHILEAPGLKEWFEGATQVGNPDALLLALTIREKAGVDKEEFGKLLPFPYSPNKLFTVEHLSLLSECLKESTFCQPRTHSVWYSLVNILLPENALQDFDTSIAALNSIKKHKKSRKGSSAVEDVEKNLKNFCEVIIEGSLLSSSHERKNLAFNVLLLLFPKLPASCIYNVLSYKVVQCLMDVLSTKETRLFKASQYFLRELSEWVKHDDIRRVAVIVALQKHSNGKFDCITRTKTVKELMAEFKTEPGCMLLIQNLADMFLDEGHASEEPSDQSQTTDDNSEIGPIEDKDSVGASDFLKGWVVESLPNSLKHLTLDTSARYRVQKEILKFLAIQGLFSSTLGTEVTSFELGEKFRWPKSAISSALCRMCIEQLQLLLSNAQKGEGPHVVASGVEANDLGAYFMLFLTTLRNIPSVSLFRSLSDDDEEAFQKLQSMESQLSRQERNLGPSVDANKFRSMRHLLIQLLLQVLLRPGEFSEAASELVICCTKAFQSSDLLTSSGEDEADEAGADGTPELMDVLVDTMLSLLPQSSAPMRTAIEQVFKCFCHGVTDDGLRRMLRVIMKDLKPARHQETDSENEDDDDEDDDVLDIEEAEDSDEAEIDETAESDGQADDSETVVGVKAASPELLEASDDDSDGGMDDDTMFGMDTYLVKMFKEQTNQGGGETAHSQLVLFKLRVLSLLEIYLHENPGKPQVLKIFSILAQAFVNPHTTKGSEQLSQRIWGILQKKIFKAKDYPRGDDIQFSVLESLLKRNLRLAAKPFKKKKSASNSSNKKQSGALNRYKTINSLAQSSTFWVLKIIDARKFPESELQGLFDIFEGVLQGYFDSKKSQMKCEFLKEIFKRRHWIGHHLFGVLLEKCASGKLQFRRIEALELVIEILKSFTSANPEDSSQDSSKKKLKSHLPKLVHLINELLKNMPDKASRRADVRKFFGKVIQVLTNLNLKASFLRILGQDCESQLTEMFPALIK